MLYICVTSISIGFHMTGASTARKNADEMNAILDETPNIECNINRHKESMLAPRGHGTIEFKDIHFAYPSRPDIEVSHFIITLIQFFNTFFKYFLNNFLMYFLNFFNTIFSSIRFFSSIQFFYHFLMRKLSKWFHINKNLVGPSVSTISFWQKATPLIIRNDRIWYCCDNRKLVIQ